MRKRAPGSRCTWSHPIFAREIRSDDEYEVLDDEHTRWTRYNSELLRVLFDNDSLEREYNFFTGFSSPINPHYREKAATLKQFIKSQVTRLEAILDKLELFEEPDIVRTKSGRSPEIATNEIFIVHGRDEASKVVVARFVENLGLRPIILHEQPSGGRTIIEKLEEYGHVHFAIVLLAPDDTGALGSEALRPRARQNVIFELGYFLGVLGRGNVCALYKGVELPSDFAGVVYVPLDDSGAWKLALAREFQHAGIRFDAQALLG